MRGQRLHLRLSLLHTHAVAEATDHEVVAICAIGKLPRRRSERQVDVSVRGILHSLRHDADDGVRTLVEFDLTAQHRRVCCELPFPESVIQQRHTIAARLAIGFAEHASQLCLGPQHGEETRRSNRRDNVRCIARPGEAHVGAVADCKALKGARLSRPILVVGESSRLKIAVATAARLFGQRHHTMKIGNRQRPKYHRIHAAEAGRVDAHSEPERNDRGNRKSRRLAQLSHGITNIPPEAAQSQSSIRTGHALLCGSGIAELQQRLATRLFRRHSGGEIRVDAQRRCEPATRRQSRGRFQNDGINS